MSAQPVRMLTDGQIDAEFHRWNFPDASEAMAFHRMPQREQIAKAFKDGLLRGLAISADPSAQEPQVGVSELSKLRERYKFLLRHCWGAQDVAAERGWALRAVIDSPSNDPAVLRQHARNGLLSASPPAQAKVPDGCKTDADCQWHPWCKDKCLAAAAIAKAGGTS